MTETMILTELGSSSHTYNSTCVIEETVPAMREKNPVIRSQEGGHGQIVNTGHSQCHITQSRTQVRLTSWLCKRSDISLSGNLSCISPLSWGGCAGSSMDQYAKMYPLTTALRQKNSARYVSSTSAYVALFPTPLSNIAPFLTKERRWTSRTANCLA